jgi:hypothetical protein
LILQFPDARAHFAEGQAILDADVLAERLMGKIDRIANMPCPLAHREQKIAELGGEIDRLMRLSAPRAAGLIRCLA